MSRVSFPLIDSKEALVSAVNELGVVPFFRNSLPGFSIAENVSPDAWFSDGEGVWEWKGPVIRETGCAYGKFFSGKAAFVSRELFPDLANFRRDGYDFDARYDDGLASFREKELYDLVSASCPVLSRDLKREGNYGKSGKKGFDALIAGLQKRCYVLISDFVYDTDKGGKQFGWGVAEYATPERLFGPRFREEAYARSPEESEDRLLARLKNVLPDESEEALRRWISL